MSLRDKLEEILPTLLPQREEDAIKGTELIARVRAVLGDAYSDRSLRSLFSFISLEEDSCLAKVPGGQGYYLRPEQVQPSLHNAFAGGGDATALSPLHKAIALTVRLFDTAGMGVFVYPVEEEESWCHPDLVAVQWPAGVRNPDGSYTLEPTPGQPLQAFCTAVCVAFNDGYESCRKALFRALSCGTWAHGIRLILFPGEEAEPVDTDELAAAAAQFGIGLHLMEVRPERLPRADVLYRAEPAGIREILSDVPQVIPAAPLHRTNPQPIAPGRTDLQAVEQWVQHCLNKKRIEACEQRVAVN